MHDLGADLISILLRHHGLGEGRQGRRRMREGLRHSHHTSLRHALPCLQLGLVGVGLWRIGSRVLVVEPRHLEQDVLEDFALLGRRVVDEPVQQRRSAEVLNLVCKGRQGSCPCYACPD